MPIVCVCVLKYNLTILELVSTPHIHPQLGCYAPSRVCPPPFKNSGSAPEASLHFICC